MTNEHRVKLLDDVPASAGKDRLAKHWRGERLTRREAILAKCCDCMGYYRDGRADCGVTHCALYPFMPYRAGRHAKDSTPDVVDGPKGANGEGDEAEDGSGEGAES